MLDIGVTFLVLTFFVIKIIQSIVSFLDTSLWKRNFWHFVSWSYRVAFDTFSSFIICSFSSACLFVTCFAWQPRLARPALLTGSLFAQLPAPRLHIYKCRFPRRPQILFFFSSSSSPPLLGCQLLVIWSQSCNHHASHWPKPVISWFAVRECIGQFFPPMYADE